jgi:hypothetical protein
MTESSQPLTTVSLVARLTAEGKHTRTDGLGQVYVRTYTSGRSAWVLTTR